MWDNTQLQSAEGVQQGDPLGPMLFCLGIHDLVASLSCEFRVFYMDDGTIGGTLEDVQADLHIIETEGAALGLTMNVSKSEIVSYNESAISPILSAFPGLEFTHAHETVLLGSPLGNAAMHTCLEDQIHQLKLVGERLCHLQLHDAITILRHSFSIPKLLHTLRTSPAFTNLDSPT